MNIVHLVDTMGDLRKVYSLADVVFVGRSLVPMGGSDMMEVAALGKPIVVGPHTSNFSDAMQQLLAAEPMTHCRGDVTRLADNMSCPSIVMPRFTTSCAGCPKETPSPPARSSAGTTRRDAADDELDPSGD